MDIIILTAIVFSSIALEGLIVNRARKRAEYEDAVRARLARYAGRELN
jgi:hypothetical protein